MRTLSSEQRAWLAGLIEGEGTMYSTVSGEGYVRYRLEVEMTDEDVVRRAHEITGAGNVTSRDRSTIGNKRKRVWRWTVGAKEEFFDVCEAILPFMGKRRSERIYDLMVQGRGERLADHCFVQAGTGAGYDHGGQLGADQVAA